MQDALGDKRFGRYRVVQRLGVGGMGEVYLAEDDVLGRQVAIKTVHPRGLAGAAADIYRTRFAHEAKAAAALSHPNIVPVFDLGVEGETPFLVMELVAGQSLKAHLEDRRLSPDQARMLGIQIARALDAAHARGIVHRDVKPANILEHAPGNWKLADFGIARVPTSSLTVTGQFLGSPAYAPPEALAGGEQNARGDVYGLGATLYEALSGRSPHGEHDLASVAAMIEKRDPVPLATRVPELPRDLADAVMHALARDPAKRPSASQLADELAGVGSAKPTLASVPLRRAKLVWIVGAVLVAVVITILAERRGPASDRDDRLGGAAAAIRPESPPAVLDTPDHAERWQDVQNKLDDHEFGDAREALQRLVEDYPNDDAARALLDQLSDGRGPIEGDHKRHHPHGPDHGPPPHGPDHEPP
jgi:serine/threonine protein kinase